MDPKELLPSHLAEAMKMTEGHLWRLSESLDLEYWPTRKRLVGAKLREIDAPKPLLKKRLRSLHRFLSRNFRPHGIVHGGALGRSCVTSASTHRGRKYIVSRDIKNCYPSIPPAALHDRLLQSGFRADTALLLSRLLTVRGRVPQGSPVSSDALNLFLHDADVKLGSLCGRRSARITRTYDDIVVSLDDQSPISEIGEAVESQIASHGLVVNQRKKAESGLQIHGKTPKVHNVVVEDRRGVGLPTDQARKAVALAEAYCRSAKAVSAESLPAVAAKRQQVHGWMHYCRQLRFGPAAHIRRLLEAGDRYVRRRLGAVGLGGEARRWWVQSAKRNEPDRIATLWRRRLAAGAA